MVLPQHEPGQPPSGGCVAAALIVLGGLILVPSGLCTAIFGIGTIYSLVTQPGTFGRDFTEIAPFALAIIVVAAIGYGLIRAGLSMRERK